MKKKLKIKTNGKGDRLQQLQAVANQCNKALGSTGAVYLGSEQRAFERVPTGIVALDYVLGGGLVRGQMIQFTGAESCFKTTAAMISAANIQKNGGLAVWVAGEGFDKSWAAKHGVDIKKLLIVTANMGDVALETAMTLLESGLVDVMVFDSFQSLGTSQEMEGAVDDPAYASAGAPQMWGRVMRRVYAAGAANACLIGISQVRAKIGGFSGHGPPEPEGTGIWAIKHWKCADVIFKKGEPIFAGDKTGEGRKLLSREFKLHCKKNKTAPTEQFQASFTFKRKSDGTWKVDNLGTLMRLAMACEVVERSGAWYQGFGIKAQGEDKYRLALAKNFKAQRKLKRAVFEQLNG